VLFSLAISGDAFAQQVSGRVGTGAPEDVFLTLTLAANGSLTLSKTEFKLAQGGYYRFNLVCPDSGPKNEASIEFLAPGLLENSHLRLASVSERSTGGPQGTNEINFHIQGEQFRLMECEGLPLNVRFSFYPIRKGTYPFTINNKTVQPAVELKGSFIVE
jgi:hypothetical protein